MPPHLREMHCWDPNLFWHGCYELQILGPQVIDYWSLSHVNFIVQAQNHPCVRMLSAWFLHYLLYGLYVYDIYLWHSLQDLGVVIVCDQLPALYDKLMCGNSVDRLLNASIK